MGHTIWVEVEGKTQDPSENSIMHRLMEELDALCQELGVSTLSSFYDYSVLAKEYGQEIDGLDLQQSGRWFDPAPCLKTVKALSSYLSVRPAALDFSHDSRRKHRRPRLIQELESCESTLEDASLRGRKFRFLIVP